MIPNDSLMIRKTAGVQRCVIDFTLNCPIYQVLGDCVRLRSLQTYTRWRGIADILASVSCTGWRVPPSPPAPPSPLGLAIAAAILASTRPTSLAAIHAVPTLCRSSLQSCAMPGANNCKAQCASSAGCTPQQAGRPLDTLRALHPPPDAPPSPFHFPPTQRRKDCEARQWCAALLLHSYPHFVPH